MKHLMMLLALSGLVQLSFAQTDTTAKPTDTVQVGNFIIIKKNKDGKLTDDEKINININFKGKDISIKKKPGNISTNWFIFDLGFTNLVDNTNYTAAQGMGYLKTGRPADGQVNQNSMALNSGKSSNANIWFFMQKMNVANHVLNLKYGLGLECIISDTTEASASAVLLHLVFLMIQSVFQKTNYTQAILQFRLWLISIPTPIKNEH